MQKIIPHLWFDTQAKQAAAFYETVFPQTNIKSMRVLKDTPSGDCDYITVDINGTEVQMISAGPYFKINPSVSFMVNFDPSRDSDAATQIETTWNALAEGGKIMMPLGEYPFSKRYGWVEDRFGMSWQLILTDPGGEPRPFIVPSLLFVGASYGNAEAATDYYLSVFKNSKRGMMQKYPAGMEPNREGTVMFTDFLLEDLWLCAMDGGGEHAFAFNEAVSFIVQCETQEEIDYYWSKLSMVPEAEQCGWCKDQFGISWQIVPARMGEIMQSGDSEKIARVTKAFLSMKKFDIAAIDAAANGN